MLIFADTPAITDEAQGKDGPEVSSCGITIYIVKKWWVFEFGRINRVPPSATHSAIIGGKFPQELWGQHWSRRHCPTTRSIEPFRARQMYMCGPCCRAVTGDSRQMVEHRPGPPTSRSPHPHRAAPKPKCKGRDQPCRCEDEGS